MVTRQKSVYHKGIIVLSLGRWDFTLASELKPQCMTNWMRSKSLLMKVQVKLLGFSATSDTRSS